MIRKMTIEKITERTLKYISIIMDGGIGEKFYIYDYSFTDLSEPLKYNRNEFVELVYNRTVPNFITKYTEDFIYTIEDENGIYNVESDIFLNNLSQTMVSLRGNSISNSSDAYLPTDLENSGKYIKYNDVTGLFEFGSPDGGGGGITDHSQLTSIGTKTHVQLETDIDNISSKTDDLVSLDTFNKEKTKEFTGFFENVNVVLTLNTTNRTVTLSGVVEAYYRGEKITELVDGWVSPTWVDNNKSQFLSYNGTDFIWTETYWDFADVQICYISFNSNGDFMGGLREVHGLSMDYETHKEFHILSGTYFSNEFGGNNISNIILDSNIDSERRPFISNTYIQDEDIINTLDALNTNNYSLGYFDTVDNHFKINQNASDITRLNVNVPIVNHYDSTLDEFTDIEVENGDYFNIWLMNIPTTEDTFSKNNRFIFLQGQTIHSSLDTAKLEKVQSFHFGEIVNTIIESVVTKQITIEYENDNWVIKRISDVTSSRVEQMKTASSVLGTGAITATEYSEESFTGGSKTQNLINSEVVENLNILYNNINSLSGANTKIVLDPEDFDIETTEQTIDFTTVTDSTNVEILTLDDGANTINIKKPGHYTWVMTIGVGSTDNKTQNISIRTKTISVNEVPTVGYISENIISIEKTGKNGTLQAIFNTTEINTIIELTIIGDSNTLTLNRADFDLMLTQSETEIITNTETVTVVNSETESISETATTQKEVNVEFKNNFNNYQNKINNFYKEKHITIDGATTADELFWFVSTADNITLETISYIKDSSDSVIFTIEDENGNDYVSSKTALIELTNDTININKTFESNNLEPDYNKDRIFKVLSNTTFTGQLHITLKYKDNLFI